MSAARARALAVAAACGLGLLAPLAAPAPPRAGAAVPRLGAFSCLPTSGLASMNDPHLLMAGTLTLPGGARVSLGTTGDVDWARVTPGNPDLAKHFHSLKWLELLVRQSRASLYTDADRARFLARAEAIALDWARDVPVGGRGVVAAAAWTPMYAGQRATVFTCLESRRPSPGARGAIAAHGSWLAAPANSGGNWNQGVDAAIGLLGTGCRTGRADWQDTALGRFTTMIGTSIDGQGALNEQAPGYGQYLWQRWGIAADKTAECGLAVPALIRARRPLLQDFLAWATEPSGRLVQIGDTHDLGVTVADSAALRYAASRGDLGTAPAARTRVYDAGYVFGRSTWSPFGTSVFYTLRFGPGKSFHGHEDHTALTLSALGRQLLVDSGHKDYAAGAYRDHLRSPEAHSQLVVPGAPFLRSRPTALVRRSGGAGWAFWELRDDAWAGLPRTRGVLVDTAVPFALVLDRAGRTGPGSFQQLWHLAPGMRVAVGGRSRATARTADGAVDLTLLQVPLPGQVLPAGSTSVVAGRTAPYQGWVSRSATDRTAAPVVAMSRVGRSTRQLTLLVPARAGVPVAAALAAQADGSHRVTVSVRSVRRTVILSAGGSMRPA